MKLSITIVALLAASGIFANNNSVYLALNLHDRHEPLMTHAIQLMVEKQVIRHLRDHQVEKPLIYIEADSLRDLENKLGLIKDDVLISHLLISGHGLPTDDDNGFMVSVGDFGGIFQFNQQNINKLQQGILGKISAKMTKNASVYFTSCHVFTGTESQAALKAEIVRKIFNLENLHVFGHIGGGRALMYSYSPKINSFSHLYDKTSDALLTYPYGFSLALFINFIGHALRGKITDAKSWLFKSLIYGFTVPVLYTSFANALGYFSDSKQIGYAVKTSEQRREVVNVDNPYDYFYYDFLSDTM